jgi:DNA invertase Pin-like site-specific DNA recombinase
MRSYIQNHDDLKAADVLEFSDNGFSGIDLNRKAFQELLAKVRMREIDVILVKDLSRLGRNYLDVCKLTESIFPFMGVRLVAIADNYDSNNKEQNFIDFSTTFKAVLNEFYVIESSEKVRSTFNRMIRNGRYIGKLPYGYFLSDDKLPLIDEEKAENVRQMYLQYSNGAKLYDIAKYLNDRNIPSFYGKQWCSTSIRQILINPEQ